METVILLETVILYFQHVFNESDFMFSTYFYLNINKNPFITQLHTHRQDHFDQNQIFLPRQLLLAHSKCCHSQNNAFFQTTVPGFT